jgi:hypothetical protein
MKFHQTLTLLSISVASLLWGGCSSDTSDTSDQSAQTSPFLVTEPAGDGTVSVVALYGTLKSHGEATLTNSAVGLKLNATGLEDGSMIAAFTADPGDTIKVEYAAADGSKQTAEVQPQEGLMSIHGLLTVSDEDGPEGEKPPCYILVRDDVDASSGAVTEYLLVPPPQQPPPPEDGSTPPPPPEDGSTPAPPPEGGQPPQDGSQPPPCPPPQDGSQPPQDGSQPPQDGSQPPPDGSQPPPGCHPPGPPLKDLVGQYITVVGSELEPREDAPCEGTPFGMQAVIPDEGAGGAAMEGAMEEVTVSAGSSSDTCWTLRRTDIVDESGEQPDDLVVRFELVGEQADELRATGLTKGELVSITAVPFDGPTRCGFQGVSVTSYEILPMPSTDP